MQIRTHAQKYFLKLSKARQNGEITGQPLLFAAACSISLFLTLLERPIGQALLMVALIQCER